MLRRENTNDLVLEIKSIIPYLNGDYSDGPKRMQNDRYLILLYGATMIDEFKQRGTKHGRLLYFSYPQLKYISKNRLLDPPGPLKFESTRTARDKVYPSLRAKKWVRIERIDIESFKGAECVAITKKGIDNAIQIKQNILNGLSKEAPQIQQRLVYQDDRKIDENLRKELCQNYGLNWLSSDFFESHKSIESDLDSQKKGFPFDLPSIKMKQELRRENILEDIKRNLDSEGKLLIIGQSGISKTTILMELMCDYFDAGYEVLYSYGATAIRNEDGLVNFIENILRNGKRILVAIDNAHDERTSSIFYVIDKLSTYKLTRNVRFIVTARIPEFDLFLKDSLDKVQEEIRRSIRKLNLNPNLKYHLPYFTKEEIKQFIRLYSKIIDNKESDKKAEEIYADTRGDPIMVTFSVFGQGLDEDVKKTHARYLKSPLNMKTMLICSLLDMSNIEITDAILKRCGVLEGAYGLDGATLSQNNEGLWRTKHARWDQELFSYLYNEHSRTLVEHRKQVLIDSLIAIYSMKEEQMTHSVIGTLYDIADLNCVPIDLADAVFQQSIHTYLSNEKKRSFCIFRENQDSPSDEYKSITSKTYLLLEKVHHSIPLEYYISPRNPHKEEVKIGANVIIFRRLWRQGQNEQKKIIGYGQVRDIVSADSTEKKEKLPEFARYPYSYSGIPEHDLYQTVYIDKFVPSDSSKSLPEGTEAELRKSADYKDEDTITVISKDFYDRIIYETRFD